MFFKHFSAYYSRIRSRGMSDLLLFPELNPLDFAGDALWNVTHMCAAFLPNYSALCEDYLVFPSLPLADNLELVVSAANQLEACAYELAQIIDAHEESLFEFRCNLTGIRFMVHAVACANSIWITQLYEIDNEFDRLQMRFSFFG
jgi:hypothetical protein